MTRLPIPTTDTTDETAARAPRHYPAVGLTIGVALAGVFAAASQLLPSALAALISVAVGIRLTGALHEDGLADTADGLGGGWTKDRALEIMRDSRIGVYGMITLVLALAIKVTALAYLPVLAAMAAMIAGHTLGRFAITQMITQLPYARTSGAGDALGHTPPTYGVAPWVMAALAVIIVGFVAGILSALAVAIATAAIIIAMTRWLRRKLDGFTGDTLGAAEQVVETALPVVILACL